LIPAGVISAVDDRTRSVHVNMSKEQIKAAPDWGEQTSADWQSRYNDYYGPFGS
jgi:hypothetical protein